MALDALREDFVVDLVLEVGSRGIDVEDLARALQVPGRELSRGASDGRVWVTAVLCAECVDDAIAAVRDRVLDQLPAAAGTLAVTIDTCLLSDLYCWLDPTPTDEELDRVDVRDLVAERVWNHNPPTDRVLDLRGVRVLGDA